MSTIDLKNLAAEVRAKMTHPTWGQMHGTIDQVAIDALLAAIEALPDEGQHRIEVSGLGPGDRIEVRALSAEVEQLQADAKRARMIANELTLETQTVEDWTADLARQVREARARLEASERGAAAMRAALERTGKALNNIGVEFAGPSSEPHRQADTEKLRTIFERHGIEESLWRDALAADAGRGWLSPEVVERVQKHLEEIDRIACISGSNSPEDPPEPVNPCGEELAHEARSALALLKGEKP